MAVTPSYVEGSAINNSK